MEPGLGDIWGATALSATLALIILGGRGFRRDFAVGGILAVLAGIVAVFPTVWLEALIGSPYPQDLLHAPIFIRFIHAFVLSALVEELLKFSLFWVLFRRSPLFQARSDGVLLGVLVGVGFGSVESVNRAVAAAKLTATEAVLPAWLAPYALHLVAGGAMGFLFYRAYQEILPSRESRSLFAALIVPFVFHGVYNFVASSPSEAAWIWASLFVLVGAFSLLLVLGEAKARSAPAEDAAAGAESLESDDPVGAIVDLPASPQTKAALAQELLARNGITGYSIVSLLRASDGVLTLKSIWLKDFQVCTIKLLSPKVVDPAGVGRFRQLFERVRDHPPASLLKYREFHEFPMFLAVIRDYGFATLSEYVSALLTREERVDLALQILALVKDLWQKGLYHGRLTPQNLVFRQGQMTLADLGQALVTRDKERHRAFLEESSAGEEPWSFARDYRAVRALLSWLAGDEAILPMDTELSEAGGPTIEEPVERAEIALERYQVQSRSLARLLAERAKRSFQQEGAGYTDIGIVALFRSQALAPNAELTSMLERASESALAEANEALLDRTPERALQSLARYMELRPDASELAGAQLENITTGLLKKGDHFLLRKGNPSLAVRYYRAANALNPGATEPRGRLAMVAKVPLLPAGAIYQFVLLSALVVLVTVFAAQRVALQRPDILMSRATPEGWRTTATLGIQPSFQSAWQAVFRDTLSPYIYEDPSRVIVFGEKRATVLGRATGGAIGSLVLSDEYGGSASVTAQPLLCDKNLLVPLKTERGSEVRYSLKVFGKENAGPGSDVPVTGRLYGLGCWKNKALVISSHAVLRVDLSEKKPDWKWSPEIGGITADGAIYGNLLLVPVGLVAEEPAPVSAPEAPATEPEQKPESAPEEPAAGEGAREEAEEPAPGTPSAPAEPSAPERAPERVTLGSERSLRRTDPYPVRLRMAAANAPTAPRSFETTLEEEFVPHIIALSVHTGEPVFALETKYQADYGLVVSGNSLVVAAKDFIASYDLRWRRLRWANSEASVKWAPVTAEGSVLVSGEQRASVLDLKTGAGRLEGAVVYPVAEAAYASPYFVVPSARPHPLFPSARVHSLVLISANDPGTEEYIDLFENDAAASIKAIQVAPDFLFVVQKDGERENLRAYRIAAPVAPAPPEI